MLLRAAVLGGGALLLSGIARVAEAFGPSPAGTTGGFASASPGASPRPGKSSGTKKGSGAGHAPPGARVIANLDGLQVGSPIPFTGPGNTPGVLLRLSGDRVVAYSRICTHAGCTVGYDSAANLLVCPCHGAEYDPTKGAAVVAGPAPQPLRRISVRLDPSTRKVYLVA